MKKLAAGLILMFIHIAASRAGVTGHKVLEPDSMTAIWGTWRVERIDTNLTDRRLDVFEGQLREKLNFLPVGQRLAINPVTNGKFSPDLSDGETEATLTLLPPFDNKILCDHMQWKFRCKNGSAGTRPLVESVSISKVDHNGPLTGVLRKLYAQWNIPPVSESDYALTFEEYGTTMAGMRAAGADTLVLPIVVDVPPSDGTGESNPGILGLILTRTAGKEKR